MLRAGRPVRPEEIETDGPHPRQARDHRLRASGATRPPPPRVEPLLISGFQPGGQLMITTDVENYPGFAEAIQGPWLMEQMRLQAEHVGTKIVSEYITKVDLKVRPFQLEADSGETYSADAVIIATGAQAKWLGIPSEAAFQGGGVAARR